MKSVGAYLIALAIFTPGIFLAGWTLTLLWAWFMVPTFGLPQLSLAAAIGIDLTICFITNQYIPMPTGDEDAVKSLGGALMKVYITPFITLGIGYLVHIWGMP